MVEGEWPSDPGALEGSKQRKNPVRKTMVWPVRSPHPGATPGGRPLQAWVGGGSVDVVWMVSQAGQKG